MYFAWPKHLALLLLNESFLKDCYIVASFCDTIISIPSDYLAHETPLSLHVEMKSEKAGSCRESNLGHLWLEPPVLCH